MQNVWGGKGIFVQVIFTFEQESEVQTNNLWGA